MKRPPIRVAAVGAIAALALATGPTATATEHEEEPLEVVPHAHLLIIGAEVDFSGGEPVLLDYVRCVDIAANRALPLNSHHHHAHTGRAGEALGAAGHIFIFAAPLFDVPWTDCASFLDIYYQG